VDMKMGKSSQCGGICIAKGLWYGSTIPNPHNALLQDK
jgi:hypothetical protein